MAYGGGFLWREGCTPLTVCQGGRSGRADWLGYLLGEPFHNVSPASDLIPATETDKR